MQATEIIEKITSAGGRIWLEEDKVRAHLPETLRPLVNVIRSHKSELVVELSRRPAMPSGVRLIRWDPKEAPVHLSQCSTVTDVEKFISTTLVKLAARLSGKTWQDGGWGLSGLLGRLEACGCIVALDDPQKELQ